ncbi:NAD(P)H-dependent oxidoreductase [Salinibacterium sp. NSLL150]|uniref:NAD(P)H-dependent oxidoreductase n=1 Tax=unclassified Salinibacterium TaxID=2632331 RepID=UPI0018CF7A93|nr:MULTISPECIES: NAD(P)H-dependent oxidoreductase [unclassified Salinibacterium]MBH0097666.1 NAD(P)H-dependent oxidoreductase [Salinibacterium sp. NSLL35]MBH0100421.1 NAD(P)H-dependent oxidoreductase [Salinibacterium sp. NSLL150]MBH0103180.1 NAD(P)H-dependent oxidoreductase [Salinibacterium sp. NSLL16]MBH0105941.1 NAD(P)H-dependent oxidoreductase [Salinibacterium sp. NSLL17]
MNTLIIDGHPNPDSLCAAIASAYAEGHGDAAVVALRDLQFEPSLRFGYTRRQELEPDLERAWQLLLDARHVVVVTPVWWGSVPTLLKGFFDRLLLPRRAYRIRKNGTPEGLLTGRTGRVIVTADSPSWYLRLVGDTTVRHVRDRTLAFCGIKPVHTTRFGPVKNSTLEQREGWLAKSASLGETDAARLARKRPTGSATEATAAERVGAR